MSDDNHDRAAILARRAVLVASALATVGVTARADAQSGLNAAEECAPRRDPSAEELEEAKRLAAQAELDGGDHDAAIAKLLRAYTLAPRPGVAALLMSRHEAAGDFDAAHDTAKRELACGGPNPELSARVADLERRTGLLRVFDAGAGIATVHIGHRTFDFLRARASGSRPAITSSPSRSRAERSRSAPYT